MKYILYRFKLIKTWRWIAVSIFLLGLSSESFKTLSFYGLQPTLLELIIKQTNNVSTLSLYFIFLIIIFDIGLNDIPTLEISIKQSRIFQDYFFVYAISLLYLILIIIINILYILLISGNLNLSNEWVTAPLFTDSWASIPALDVNGITPLSASAISFLLLTFRFGLFTFLVFTINQNCKQHPWGYLGGLIICLIDAVAYYTFNVVNLAGIFPFEHSFLYSVMNLTSSISLNILISVLYWVALSSLSGIALVCLRRSKKLTRRYRHEANHLF